jgi:hypothetical protein
MLLGDAVKTALTRVGITSDRIEAWLGQHCGCAERKEKLNQLHRWVVGVFLGRVVDAKKRLDEIIEEGANE